MYIDRGARTATSARCVHLGLWSGVRKEHENYNACASDI